MNIIKRNVFLLTDSIPIPICVVKGSDLYIMEFTIRDFAIPDGASAVAYAAGTGSETKKRLCDVTGNVITLEPTDALFTEGINVLQIRIFSEGKSITSFNNPVHCHKSIVTDDAEETGSDPTLLEQILAKLNKDSGGNTVTEITAESIKEALGYTPANAENYDELSAAINKKTSTFYVSITESGGNFVADKTMEEITKEHESGNLIFARVLYGDIPIVLSTVMDQTLPEMILFAGSFGNITIGVNIMADDTVSVTMQETALAENIPQKTSQLINDSEFLKLSQVDNTYAKKATTLSGYGITDGAKKSGWVPDKHIGTDANGNMVAIETFTESEKETLKQEIIDAIKVEYPDAHVIYGDVDSENNIVIFGELADGTYTLKYENEDGTVTEIGTLVVGGYTNWANAASSEWLDGQRFNSSLNITAQNQCQITNFVPCKAGDTIRVKGLNIGYYGTAATTPARSRLCMYTDDKTNVYASVIPTDSGVAENTDDEWTYVVGTGCSVDTSTIRHIRFCGDLYDGYAASDVIITVNEAIS